MNKLQLIAIILISVALFTSCTPDSSNPCGTTCKNGGQLMPGCSCSCPIGFGGPDCSIAVPPKSVTVSKIIVKNFPMLKTVQLTTGAIRENWDPGTTTSKYPDIFININAGETSSAVPSSEAYSDVSTVPQTYTIAGKVLSNPTSYYTISLYDADGAFAIPELMGGIKFIPANYKSYPPTITLISSTIEYTVYVTWNF